MQRKFRHTCATALAVASPLMAIASIYAMHNSGPALLLGAMSVALVATAGSIDKRSRLAPAVFVVDVALLGIAVVIHWVA